MRFFRAYGLCGRPETSIEHLRLIRRDYGEKWPRSLTSVGNFRRIRADTPSEPISRIQVENSRFSLSHPSRMSNALRSGLPGQGHLKRGGSATCLKISSMLSRPAVPTVTLRIVRPAVRTSFPAMSITSRRSLFAYVCTGGERNSRFRGLSVFAGLEPVLLERLVEIESPGHRPSRKPCWERSPGTASAWPVGPSAPDGPARPALGYGATRSEAELRAEASSRLFPVAGRSARSDRDWCR